MVTIVGNGMGEYGFSNINVNMERYDTIVCDSNFTTKQHNVIQLSFNEIKEYIVDNHKYEDILYIVTGSPLFFSGATVISKLIPKKYIKIINNISSKSYLLEKLILNENEVSVLSLHGRKKLDLEEFLNKEYTFILADQFTIQRLQDAMSYFKKDSISATIGYKLGYEDEKIEKINIFDDVTYDLDFPYVLLLKREFEPKNTICEDNEFQTERGMITKKYKRHLSLQNLDLKPNQLLWDVGAGSGSCGIEAYKRYKVQTIFFEKDIVRAENIKENICEHYVCDSLLLIGEATTLFEQCEEDPDRIFIGGGGTKVIEKLPYLYERLREGGIILLNAITLKHLTLILKVLNEENIQYEVFSLSLTTYKGNLDLVEPERQLFQIKVKK
ncbi:precorrin-6Y C5,15-methyltransferase (decarboxylating) subunit CbiT [Sulfurospirillum arcachonense]|uniref:precorrin-6Y C5,15-methyltransferase (decarboxylating) subunit CbiT n=1 Tax=Sulfurospirillum arcachonense TaxID=57666 RepID=UPI000468F799|nr:precorrin-6Y C5,15-methyltransferase (decarboxylating) subunit CbiT [Sulfurospirillum arcachonense]